MFLTPKPLLVDIWYIICTCMCGREERIVTVSSEYCISLLFYIV